MLPSFAEHVAHVEVRSCAVQRLRVHPGASKRFEKHAYADRDGALRLVDIAFIRVAGEPIPSHSIGEPDALSCAIDRVIAPCVGRQEILAVTVKAPDGLLPLSARLRGIPQSLFDQAEVVVQMSSARVVSLPPRR